MITAMTNIVESHTFGINQSSLNVFLVSLRRPPIPEYVREVVHNAFKQLAPYLHDASQVLYIRDIPFLAIDGKYPGGHCYNRSEAMIAVTEWKTDQQQLIAAVNHELHHMARWQNPGYGSTLGGALLSEGIATYYEALRSDWRSPWSEAPINKAVALKALEQWADEKYDHKQWFFDGNLGKWAGYALGTKLATELYGSNFDLEDSIKITPARAKSVFQSLVNKL